MNTTRPMLKTCAYYAQRLDAHGDSNRAAREALIEDHRQNLGVSHAVAELLARDRHADALAAFAREHRFTEAEWFVLLMTAEQLVTPDSGHSHPSDTPPTLADERPATGVARDPTYTALSPSPAPRR